MPDDLNDNLPAFKELEVKHLGETTFEFTDTTVNVISGTVPHAGFGPRIGLCRRLLAHRKATIQ